VSILAISVALLLQALLFGDGGITAFGANSFNMAVLGSLVSYAVYRLVAGNSPLRSSRRVIAAALAGYMAINIAALMTAIEFGIQPALAHDADGTPLYAPYPLVIAVPAMMIGHVTIAGLAEMVISGGVVAWLQRTNPGLLKTTAPGAMDSDEPHQAFGWAALRPLWIGMAALMIASPLGLLAAGTAWGEWSADDFNQASAREEIAAASHGQAPPEQAPAGMARLGTIWSAPIPDYAPPFLRNEVLGYALSAMFGGGLLILACLIGGWVTRLGWRNSEHPTP
jgi:cobalt/nickel transport system permease protein